MSFQLSQLKRKEGGSPVLAEEEKKPAIPTASQGFSLQSLVRKGDQNPNVLEEKPAVFNVAQRQAGLQKVLGDVKFESKKTPITERMGKDASELLWGEKSAYRAGFDYATERLASTKYFKEAGAGYAAMERGEVEGDLTAYLGPELLKNVKEVGAAFSGRGTANILDTVVASPINFATRATYGKSNPIGDFVAGFADDMRETFTTEEAMKQANTPFSMEKVKDPAFWFTTVAENIPVSLAFLKIASVPYQGVKTLLGSSKLATVVAAVSGGTTMRAFESAAEAEETYKEARKKMTEEDSISAAKNVFMDNMKLAGLDAVQVAVALAPIKGGSGIMKTILKEIAGLAVGAVTEGGEEIYQYHIQQQALGDKMSITDRLADPQAQEAGFIGAIMGVAFQGGGRINQAAQDKMKTKYMDEVANKLPPEEKAKYDSAKTIEERETILNAIAETNEPAITMAAREIEMENKKAIEATKDILKEAETPKFKLADLKPKEDVIKKETVEEKVSEPDPLITEARQYKSAEEFVSKMQGSATQYGEYFPEARLAGLEGYKNITKLGIDPEETVTIYRGIDDISGEIKREINDGDFVTTDFDSALSYAGSPKDVVSMEVKAKNLSVSEPKDFVEDPFYTGSEYVYTKKRGEPLTKSQLTTIWKEAQPKFKLEKPFKGLEDISTVVTEKLVGKTTVSSQFISDLTKTGDLKQAERNLIRETLEEMPEGKINVQEFADKVRVKLLPLEGDLVGTGAETIVLSDEIRGDVTNYFTRTYESPIKTSAGEVHAGYIEKSDKYFAHTRIEDMADNKTRRVIEAQSDLFQKGRLADEKRKLEVWAHPEKFRTERRPSFLAQEKLKEFNKLEPYRNTWSERIIQEEIKRAAQDGKTKLQFPTGETAMEIEGLGVETTFFTTSDRPGLEDVFDIPLKPETAQVGAEIWGNGTKWIITDVLEDGKFKAVPKDVWERGVEGFPALDRDTLIKQVNLDSGAEQFDISGKVDTSNPIYRFYEKDIQKYLKRIHPEMKRITDPQGVEWFEITPKQEEGKKPVLAFKKTGEVAEYGQKEALAYLTDFKKRFNLDFDVFFVDTIIAGKSVDFYKKAKILTAHGVMTDNTIALARKLADYTAEHETVHLTLANLNKIKAFHGMTREQILKEKAKQMGVEYKGNEAKIEEQLALDFEAYMKNKHAPKGIIRRFFMTLKTQLMKMAKAIHLSNGDLVRDYYDILATGKSKGKTVKLESHGVVESFIKDQDLILGDAFKIAPEASFKLETARVANLKTELKKLQQTLHLINTGQRKASLSTQKQFVKKQSSLIKEIKRLMSMPAKFKLTPQLEDVFSEFQEMKKGETIKDPDGLIPTSLLLPVSLAKIVGTKPQELNFSRLSLKHVAEKGEEGIRLMEAFPEIINNPQEIRQDKKADRVILSTPLTGSDAKKRSKYQDSAVLEIKKEGNDIVVTLMSAKNKYLKQFDLLWRTPVPPSASTVEKQQAGSRSEFSALTADQIAQKSITGGTPTSATPSSGRSLGGLTTSDTLTKTLSETKKDVKFKLSEESDPQFRKLKGKYNQIETRQAKLEQVTQKHKKLLAKEISDNIPTEKEWEAMDKEEQQEEIERINADTLAFAQKNRMEEIAHEIARGRRKIRVGMDIKTELKEGLGKGLYTRTMRKDPTLPTFDEVTEEIREEMPDVTTSDLIESINKEVEQYLEDKGKVVESRNKLRQIKQDIVSSKKVTRTNIPLLNKAKKELDLRQEFLKKRDKYIQQIFRKGKEHAIRMVSQRRQVISQIQDTYGISDKKKKEIIGTRYIHLMSEDQFDNFIIEFTNSAEDEGGRMTSIDTVKAILAEKQYQKSDNLRLALGLPPVAVMTEKQATRFIQALTEYEIGDVFLPKRMIETTERTSFGKVVTERELAAAIKRDTNLTTQDLETVDLPYMKNFANGLRMARHSNLLKYVVDNTILAEIETERQFLQHRKKIDGLAKAARKSRNLTLKEKIWQIIVPTDEVVFDYVEASHKSQFAKENKMTPEEIEFGDAVIAFNRMAYDYLVEVYNMTSRFGKFKEKDYMVHIRRSLLETIKTEGVIPGFKEMLDSQREAEMGMSILDKKTGDIVPYEKWNPYMQYRDDSVKPTMNVANAHLVYSKTFFKKRSIDNFVPKMLAILKFRQEVMPGDVKKTKEGLLIDGGVEEFIKQYINDARGRKISGALIPTQASKEEATINSAITATSLLALGGRIGVGAASAVGEFVVTTTSMITNPKKLLRATTRTIDYKQTKRVREGVRHYIGLNPLEELLSADNNLPSRISETLMLLFSYGRYVSHNYALQAEMTEEEWKNASISDYRLLELSKEQNKWKRGQFHAGSLVGSTVIGRAGSQYLSWAFDIANTTLSSSARLITTAKKKGLTEATKTEYMKDLTNFTAVAIITTLLASLIPVDDDDRKNKTILFYIQRELKTLTSAFPALIHYSDYTGKIELSLPILEKADQLLNLSLQLLTQEKYKRDGRGFEEGDTKWQRTAQKLFIPVFIQDLVQPKTTTKKEKGEFDLDFDLDLDLDLDLDFDLDLEL